MNSLIKNLVWWKLWILAQVFPGAPRMVVLLYHSISDSPDFYTVSPTEFEKQIKYIREHFEVVSLSRAFAHAKGSTVTRNSVAVTFDDGYKNFVTTALPILEQYKIPATVFMLGGQVDRRALGNEYALMDASDKDALRNSLVEVGSHGLTHRKLTKISPEELQKEMEGSKKYITETFSVVPTYVAYPKGSYNERVIAVARAAGFEGGASVIERGVKRGDHAFVLPRIQIEGSTSFQRFKQKLTIAADWYYALWKLIH